jgi:hypothetical protein
MGVDWVELQPKKADGQVTRIRIGFIGEALDTLLMEDSFGQITRFSLPGYQAQPQAGSQALQAGPAHRRRLSRDPVDGGPLSSASQAAVHAMAPLAERMRPRALAEFRGQAHLLAPSKPLRRAIEMDRPHSMIFWGPRGHRQDDPGAAAGGLFRLPLHAPLGGPVWGQGTFARRWRRPGGCAPRTGGAASSSSMRSIASTRPTGCLPAPCGGGDPGLHRATTENPSFELNNALLSRARVYVLKALELEDLEGVMDQALADRERGLGQLGLTLAPEQRRVLRRRRMGMPVGP